MGFLGVDSPFDCVSLVQVRESQLAIDSLVVEEGDKCTGCLVVKALETGVETARG